MAYRVGIFNRKENRLSGAVDFASYDEAVQFINRFNRTGASVLFPSLGPNTEVAKGPYSYLSVPTVEETEEALKDIK